MQSKDEEVTPRYFNPTWAPTLSDEARKAVNAAFDAMSAWRIETASNNEKNREQIRSPNAMTGSPSAMLSKLKTLPGFSPAGSWPSADALAATNPMEFWMQWAEQWQKACTDAMALWDKAGQPGYGVGPRRR